MTLLLLLTACLPRNGNGVLGSELRDVGPFLDVHSSSVVHLLLRRAEAQRVELFCDEDLLPHVATEVLEDKLFLYTPGERELRPDAGCWLEVDVPTLRRIDGSGAGDVRVEEVPEGVSEVELTGSGRAWIGAIEAEALMVRQGGRVALELGPLDVGTLDLDAVSSEDVIVSGRARHAQIFNSEAGSVLGRDLVCATAYVAMNDTANLQLTVTRSVQINHGGEGLAEFWGGGEVMRVWWGEGPIVVH